MLKRKTKKLVLVLTLMSAVILLAAGCSKDNESPQQEPTLNAELQSPSLSLTYDEEATFSSEEGYTQEPESPAFNSAKDITVDGCFKILSIGSVEGRLALKVRNVSGKLITKAVLRADTQKGSLEFVITTAPADSISLLFEASGSDYDKELSYASWSLYERIDSDSELSLMEDIFRVTGGDKLLQLENISNKDIDSDIYVYYKTVKDGMFYGGETYRVKFSPLKSGELSSTIASHFSALSSKVMFIAYAQ